jgi:cobalamin biosynthesis Mg chelatase CobN
VESKIAVPVARALRVISAAICLIVIASFVIFAVEQTEGASNHQQAILNGTASVGGSQHSQGSGSGGSSTARTDQNEGTVHKAIDNAASKLTSPFSGVTSGANSVWLQRIVSLLLALIVYGFGLGYLARLLRVRL